MKLLVGSTPIALWHDIIHEAEAACTVSLKEEVEAYLVYLLVRYVDKPEMVKQVIASEFMEGLKYSPHKRAQAMQDVGDKCLLFSGLFPQMAEKRLVKISYFVNIGQSAYETLSKTHTDVYGLLARQFVSLMDILQAIRRYSKEISDLLPMQAYDLWNEAGSQRAFQLLKERGQAIPVKIPHGFKQ
jgi:hypothetical protein